MQTPSHHNLIDLTNQKFGILKVLHFHSRNKHGQLIWLCRCKCGLKTKVPGFILRRSMTKSCGCTKYLRLPKGEASRRKIIRAYKMQARKRKHIWKLSDEFVTKLLTNKCYCCGIKGYSKTKSYNNSGHFRYNGIDRINNKLGYFVKNVRTMCYICNRAKSNLTERQFQNWLKMIRNNNANG